MGVARVGMARVGVAAAAALTGGGAGLAAELVWAGRRPLPEFPDIDVSGVVPASAPSGEPPLRVVVLGDSTLTGPGLAAPEDIWLRQAIRRLRLRRAVCVVSLAVGGSRVSDVAARVDEAAVLKPDLAVVAVGSNDVIRGVPVQTLARKLGSVVDSLLDAAPVVAAANMGDLGNVLRFPAPLNIVLHMRSRQAARAIGATIERRRRAVLLDVTRSNPAFRDPGVFVADRFHPNAAGHAAWADSALPGMRLAFDRLFTAHSSPG
jgi:lysophospholipase L1-like esterase